MEFEFNFYNDYLFYINNMFALEIYCIMQRIMKLKAKLPVISEIYSKATSL